MPLGYYYSFSFMLKELPIYIRGMDVGKKLINDHEDRITIIQIVGRKLRFVDHIRESLEFWKQDLSGR